MGYRSREERSMSILITDWNEPPGVRPGYIGLRRSGSESFGHLNTPPPLQNVVTVRELSLKLAGMITLTTPTYNFHFGGQSKMVWSAFCGTTKSDLVFVPGKAKVSSTIFVRRIMQPALLPFWQHCCEEYGWTIATKDNAPGHKG